jgi:hypothetical protein
MWAFVAVFFIAAKLILVVYLPKAEIPQLCDRAPKLVAHIVQVFDYLALLGHLYINT